MTRILGRMAAVAAVSLAAMVLSLPVTSAQWILPECRENLSETVCSTKEKAEGEAASKLALARDAINSIPPLLAQKVSEAWAAYGAPATRAAAEAIEDGFNAAYDGIATAKDTTYGACSVLLAGHHCRHIAYETTREVEAAAEEACTGISEWPCAGAPPQTPDPIGLLGDLPSGGSTR